MIKIIRKNQCCGCSACLHICPKHSISFREDKEGFLYPQVDTSTCVDCGLCENVCPVLNQDEERMPLQVYAAKHTDDEIRMKSSSGGIFTLLAEQIIDKGGVVFGARFNENWEVVHDYTETKEGLAPFRGSKYVQSNIGNSYKQVEKFLKIGRDVMFTGTPCQVAGLKKYLRKNYENLLTVDFVCHGVPSPMVWRKYLKEEIARQGDVGKNSVLTSSKVSPVVTGVNFRDKSTGWTKFSFVLNFSKASADGEQNTVLSSVFTDNAYMKAFLSNLSLRPSCYACSAKAGKSGSDVTIGDFWGIENVLTEFDDDKGSSLLFINNDKVANMIDQVRVKEQIEYKSTLAANSCIRYSVDMPINRGYFYYCLSSSTLSVALAKTITPTLMYRVRRLLFRILYGNK